MAEDWQKETNQEFNIQKLFSNKSTMAVVALFFIGLFLLTFGAGMFVFKGNEESDGIKIITSEEVPTNETIIVHIDGAVNEPGVYEMESDSRVNDLVVRAGGLADDVDSSKLNLAAKIVDGQKIYLPKIGENVSYGGVAGEVSSGLINVNTASESLLDSLPGVGPVTANKIISSRPYSSVDELLSKKAVGKSVFGKIKDLVVVY